MLTVEIQRVPGSEDLPLPEYATPGAAGIDLRAAVPEPTTLAPGERRGIPTGIRIALPLGYEGQVRPSSGLARDHGIAMVNAPGTVDSDYRGELVVLLVNLGQEPVTISRGDRVAQLVVAPVTRVAWREVESLPDSARGQGGFGHTGAR